MEEYLLIILNLIYKNNWLPEIYQIGVRNPQGLEVSPFNNEVYITNHGAMGGDFLEKFITMVIMVGKF